jgi:hypothetical protein
VVVSEESSGITGILEKYRKLKLSFHSGWPVYEVYQIQSLVDAAVPEKGIVKWVFFDDD